MNVPNQISPSTPNPEHRAINSPPSQPVPPTPEPDEAETSNLGPFGERSELQHNGEKVGEMDARLGAPVPIGARVWIYEVDGIVIDYTDQLCIIVDKHGQQHAECWGSVQVQAAGPATPDAIERLRHRMDASDTNYEPLPPHVAQRVRDGILKHTPCDTLPRTHQADPAHRMANELLQFIDYIEDGLKSIADQLPDTSEVTDGHAVINSMRSAMLELENVSGNIRPAWLCGAINDNQLVSIATHG